MDKEEIKNYIDDLVVQSTSSALHTNENYMREKFTMLDNSILKLNDSITNVKDHVKQVSARNILILFACYAIYDLALIFINYIN